MPLIVAVGDFLRDAIFAMAALEVLANPGKRYPDQRFKGSNGKANAFFVSYIT
jgi:hypothetical protein